MMPAGKYYVGDLCYVMKDEWDEFCSITIRDNKVHDGEFLLEDGRRFASYTTKYGDGSYFDQYNNEYSVDAGLIGCIMVDDISSGDIVNFDLGNIIDFPQDFHCYSEHGVIHIGHVAIDTDPSGDEYN